VEPLRTVRGRAVPLLHDGIDTDVITPMKRILEGPQALVRYAFEPLRYRPDGSLDPDCALNQEAYRGAKILLAGANFGCGSSRETAVWAIVGLGLRCVVAPSFGDIFFNNCFKNGVLPIAFGRETVEALAAEARPASGPAPEFVVRLEDQTLETPSGRRLDFEVNPLRRQGLLEGLDDLDLTLQRRAAIEAFQERDRGQRPWVWERPSRDSS
jgi:3-isopropylmalate/(R)-2-methylmalate dehydratase small subunit